MANKLKNEPSLYLQQHASNPVNWYPWGEEALELAREHNLPIFLSIGYSSCHWCHVMEHESFENEEIAKVLNTNFISIKVDKEERTDIDKYFQEVYTLMNGRSGGWPTSIFLTPELKPFYSATYIPPVPKHGMMAFDELLATISKKYKAEPDLLNEKGDEILNALRPKMKIEATKLDIDIINRFVSQAISLYDDKNGGFGKTPKFPQVSTHLTLLELYKITNDKKILDMVTFSLNAMARGGIYDRVDGGFCRYSTDERWLVPHFEKMTYDNALLSELYLKAYDVTKNEIYKDIATLTIDFMIDKMSHDGLFYAASDADNNGIEGEYFVYSFNEAIEAMVVSGLSEKEVFLVADELDISLLGNFEGKSIVNVKDTNKKISNYDIAITALQDIRSKREYPQIDTKVITSWNSMMIKTLFVASDVDDKYLEIAKNSLSQLIAKIFIDNTLYHTAIGDGKPTVKAFLEDYAYFADMLLWAYDKTKNRNYLEFAGDICNEAILKFYKNRHWSYTNGIFASKAEIYDSSYPSSLAMVLSSLDRLTMLGLNDYSRIVADTLEVHSHSLMRQPISSPMLTSVTVRFLNKN